MSLPLPLARHRKETVAAPEKVVAKLVPAIEIPEPTSWRHVKVMPMDIGLGRASKTAVVEFGAQEFHERLGIPIESAQLKAAQLGGRLLALGESAGVALNDDFGAAVRAKNGEKRPTDKVMEASGVTGDEAAVTIHALAKLAREKDISMEGQLAHAMIEGVPEALRQAGEIELRLDTVSKAA